MCMIPACLCVCFRFSRRVTKWNLYFLGGTKTPPTPPTRLHDTARDRGGHTESTSGHGGNTRKARGGTHVGKASRLPGRQAGGERCCRDKLVPVYPHKLYPRFIHANRSSTGGR